jgi:hypothetical protein
MDRSQPIQIRLYRMGVDVTAMILVFGPVYFRGHVALVGAAKLSLQRNKNSGVGTSAVEYPSR